MGKRDVHNQGRKWGRQQKKNFKKMKAICDASDSGYSLYITMG